MKLDSSQRQAFHYFYLLQSDGIGSQFIHISQLLDYAEKNDCKVLVDFRKISFFVGDGLSYDRSELNKVFAFDSDHIVYSSEAIDKILEEQPNQVVGVLFSEEYYFPAVWDLPIIPASELLLSTSNQYSSCYLKDKLKLSGEYKESFEKYQRVVSSCVGVHARLGNGEYERHIEKQKLKRMKVSLKTFFQAMDSCQDDNLFVCTDTPSFLNRCFERYGNRIVCLDRFMPSEGHGPGHNVWYALDEQARHSLLKEKIRVGPYRLLGEALVEMLLLGECKGLICNESSFTHYARRCCDSETVLLN